MKGTTTVVDELRAEGYEVNCGYVQYLLRDRILVAPEKGPGGLLIWAQADIERLKATLRRRSRGSGAWSSSATTCTRPVTP